MSYHSDRITYFGETDFRNKKTKFGIKPKDRTRHMYIIGKTGVGKSVLLENMIIQDIQAGDGVGLIDPHGSLAEKILDFIPEERIKDVLYFAPFDMEYPIAFNVLEDIGPDKRHLVVSGIMSVFKKVWQDAWSARMEYILNNTLLALIEYPGSTLMSVNKMLSEKDFRKKVVDNVTDPAVKSFWVDEFAKYTERFAQEATPAIQNKIGQYTSNPLLRNIIGQPKSSFDIRDIMDNKKIFIMNLSKGRIGEQNMNLLGGLFVTKIYLAAMSRAELPESEIEKLPPFYFYVDEFQNFANESFAEILSEARKYKLALTVANQYVTQMVEEVRDAILGNVGSMVTFRIGPSDAEIFEKEYAPTFEAQDLTNLGFAQIYLRLMIDGMTSKPFSASTLPPMPRPERIYRDEIIAASRNRYAHPRVEIEENIKKWHEETSGRDVKKNEMAGAVKEARMGTGMQKPFEGKLQFNPAPPVRTESEYPPRPQTSHRPPAPRTEARPAAVKKEHSAPRSVQQKPAPTSPKLQDLLSKLESKDVPPPSHERSPKEETVSKSAPVVRQEPPSSAVQPKEDSKENSPSISLKDLSHFSKKDPTPEKKAELKALLSRVMKKSEPAPQTAEKKEERKPAAAESHTQTPHSHPAPKKKEVPEEVLKKILSS